MKNYKSIIEFAEAFSTSDQCYQFLSEQKWSKGFSCRKCDHTIAIKGRLWYYRKCQKCQYDESCTSHTLFHKVKFPIVKAFWITYQLSTLKKGMSTMEIARQYGIHQETAWFFKRKVQQAMQSGGRPVLADNVEVDETTIGGSEEGKPGRSHGKKRIVQVAVEIKHPDEDDVGRSKILKASAVIISGYSAIELREGIDKMVDKEAVVSTDGLPAYSGAVGDRWHTSFLSDSGNNFQQLHWYIFNLKNWIRGIHHKVSADHLQRYLDEFNYRFNRRNQIASCPLRLLNRMIKEPWLPYQQAKGI